MATWIEASTLPYDFYNGSAVILDGEIHILGSAVSGNYTKHYKYSNGSWSEVSTLPYSFYLGSAVVLDGEIHILGSGVSGNYTKHYKYSNGSWSEVSTLPYNFYYASAVVLDDEINILGGSSSGNYTKHYKYSNGSWSEVSTLPYNFYSGSAVVLNDEIHILGSGVSDNRTKHYKYSNGSWSEVSTLPYSFYQGSAVVLDDEIHILSGNSSDYIKHYKYYTPINKVVYGDKTLLDLTSDTVTADKILQGYTAHDASGAEIIGNLNPDSITPSEEGVYFTSGYKNMITSGFAYSEKPSVEPKAERVELGHNSQTKTLSGLTVGKKYIVLIVSGWSNSNTGVENYVKIDSISGASNFTELIAPNIRRVYQSATAYNTYARVLTSMYSFIAAATSATITMYNANGGYATDNCFLIEAN